MAFEIDKRESERVHHETPVKICLKEKPDKCLYGRIFNYSEKGIYLETNAELTMDKTYIIRMLNFEEKAKGPEKYKEYQGIVRWTHTNESYDEYSYSDYNNGYGLEFPEPVKYH